MNHFIVHLKHNVVNQLYFNKTQQTNKTKTQGSCIWCKNFQVWKDVLYQHGKVEVTSSQFSVLGYIGPEYTSPDTESGKLLFPQIIPQMQSKGSEVPTHVGCEVRRANSKPPSQGAHFLPNVT